MSKALLDSNHICSNTCYERRRSLTLGGYYRNHYLGTHTDCCKATNSRFSGAIKYMFLCLSLMQGGSETIEQLEMT